MYITICISDMNPIHIGFHPKKHGIEKILSLLADTLRYVSIYTSTYQYKLMYLDISLPLLWM